MKKKITTVFKFFVFFAIGAFLLYLALDGIERTELIEAMKKADLRWIWISVVIGIFSHISRAVRWNILIKPLGYTPKLLNTFFAVMAMYLANTAIPRSGEITRCGLLKRYEKISVSNLLGTIVVERTIDFIILLLLLAIVFVFQLQTISDFFSEKMGGGLLGLLFSPKFWILSILAFLFIAVAIYLFRKRIKALSIYDKLVEIITNFIDGLKAIKKVENKGWFVFHSIFIYVLYFLMIYVCFYAFDATRNLYILSALTVFVMSGLGMVAPAPGGIGPWHYMVINTLVLLYSIDKVDASAFAFLVHGAMTLMLVVVGFFSLVALPIYNRRLENNE